jgi:predicted amidohydrolase YtcJ
VTELTLWVGRIWPDVRSAWLRVGGDGRVAAIGRGRPPGRHLDLRDCFLLPGFVDAHVHVGACVAARAGIDISSLREERAILRRVRDGAAGLPAGAWVSVYGLGQWPVRLSGEALESVSGGRPVRARHRSLHGWVLGPSAVRRLRLDRDPLAGTCVSADGFVVDHHGVLRERMGRITGAAFESGLAAWSRAAAAAGITALADATSTNAKRELGALAAWRRRGLLLQRASAFTAFGERAADLPLLHAGYKLVPPFPALRERLEAAARDDVTVAVHCTDSGELGELIEAAEVVGGPLRLRVEHAAVAPPEFIPRLRALRATVVTQPAFVLAHGDRYLRERDGLPPEWLHRQASWEAGGVRVAFGSDAPAGPLEPLVALRAATRRRTAAGRPFVLAEKLSVARAVAAATANAAVASALPECGRLHVGSPADAVAIRPGRLGRIVDPDARVALTLVGGRIVEAA